MPGRKSRALALRDNAQEAIGIVYGSATLFVMAAFVEALWSSQTWIPLMVKYGVGIALWLLVISYFTRLGRGASHETGCHHHQYSLAFAVGSR